MSLRAGSPNPMWTAFTSSAIGAQHVRTGLVNQDAVKARSVQGATAVTIAAVADGHGGTRYIRSDVGSRQAVQLVCDIGAELAPDTPPAAAYRQIDRLLHRMVATLVSRWREEVLAHVTLNPFTPEDAQRAGADLEGDPYISYGCTILIAVLTARWIGLAQIGDGDVLAIALDGTTRAPVPGDDRLVGGETTSLCLETAGQDARYAVLTGDLPAMVLLATDGYGNSFASPDWRHEVGEGFAELIRADDIECVATRLPQWLEESAEAGGDDVTMALLVHERATNR